MARRSPRNPPGRASMRAARRQSSRRCSGAQHRIEQSLESTKAAAGTQHSEGSVVQVRTGVAAGPGLASPRHDRLGRVHRVGKVPRKGAHCCKGALLQLWHRRAFIKQPNCSPECVSGATSPCRARSARARRPGRRWRAQRCLNSAVARASQAWRRPCSARMSPSPTSPTCSLCCGAT